MKNVFLDTDLGNDCDDVGAISILANLSKLGKCNIVGITASSSRRDSLQSASVLCNYYGLNVPLGELKDKGLAEDISVYGAYGRALNAVYNNPYRDNAGEDAVKVMRRVLAGSQDLSITMVAIGYQRNIYNLLTSQPDEISPLTGVQLFNKKVLEFIAMAGNFTYDGDIIKKGDMVEWNVMMDVSSAKYVLQNVTCPVVFVPFEVGKSVYTGKNFMKDLGLPTGLAYAVNCGGLRPSWDPITALFSVFGENDYWLLSNAGRIVIDDNGYTDFVQEQGNHKVLLRLKSDEDTACFLEKYMY